MDAHTTVLNRTNAHTLNLARRVTALQKALDASEGRIDHTTAEKARSVLQRAGRRAALSGEKTVIALAGPTGVGKSSLFNALIGKDIADVSVKRPTTSQVRAVTWGKQHPNELLDWLGAGSRHLLEANDPHLTDLILLDLPDYDSVEIKHRETVDRLIEVVDALIWVVDPEKYADAALHEGYLQPLNEYAEVMMVAFNKSDQLSEADMNRCVRDLRQILNDNRLQATRIVVTAAQYGTGVAALLEMIKKTAAAKIAMTLRVLRDIRIAAYSIEIELGKASPVVNRQMVSTLAASVSDVVGVREKAASVEQDWLSKGWAVTGWPFVSRRHRKLKDPLQKVKASKRVKVDLSNETGSASFQGAVGRAKLSDALQSFADNVSADLPAGWKRAIWTAANREVNPLLSQLSDIASQNLVTTPKVSWWSVFRVLKIMGILTVVTGIGWLVSAPILSAFNYEPFPATYWFGLPAPVVLLIAGIVFGVLLGLLGRLLVRPGARRRAKTVTLQLLDQIEAVMQARVADPVVAELTRLSQAQAFCRTAIN
ncbi:MAG: 50S ribosome-binding GTPase [Propionibacteriaceae bacterium]|nr:50S ribosome-binding GTPase [Propionibacteriaceae bacterium]